MESLTGGELLDVIKKESSDKQNLVAKMLISVAQALEHMHYHLVTHKDLKSANIMFSAQKEAKVIDFGLSEVTQSKNQKMKKILGTPEYMAPEILEESYGQEIDIWSLGVVTYEALAGQVPFQGNTVDEVFSRIKQGSFDTSEEALGDSSELFINLLRQMLTVGPKTRITPYDLLNSPLFYDLDPEYGNRYQVDKELLQILESHSRAKPMKHVYFKIRQKFYPTSPDVNVTKKFNSLDTSNNGVITARELEEAFKKSGDSNPKEKAEKIIKSFQRFSKSQISFSDFEAAIQADQFSNSKQSNQQEVTQIFAFFDPSLPLNIESKAIKESLKSIGIEMEEKVFEEVVQQVQNQLSLEFLQTELSHRD